MACAVDIADVFGSNAGLSEAHEAPEVVTMAIHGPWASALAPQARDPLDR